MDTKQENTESIEMMLSTFETPRAKAMLAFAQKRGIEKDTVTCPDGSIHAAAMYAFRLWINASELCNSQAEEIEMFQVVALMSALEECATDNWSYGTRLIYDMRAAGIAPSRRETALFLAMEDSWSMEKNLLLERDPYAVAFYCGRLQTLHLSLPGDIRVWQEGTPVILPPRKSTAMETIEELAMNFIPECIGRDNTPKLVRFLKYLRNKTDFYAHASADNEFEEGSLANHAVDTIYKLVELTKPSTPADVGICVLAGMGMDLSECYTIIKRDEAGNAVFDSMPFGHGRKSVYIMGAYLENCLPESVASAIDGHMNDCAGNPRTPLQMMEQPLGLWLHIADITTTYNKNKN